jgi:hypothetical protein
VREQPVVRLFSGDFRWAHDRAQVLAASHAVEMVEANPSEAGDFLICKKLLTRSDGDHFDPPSLRLNRPFRVPQNCAQRTYSDIYRAIMIPFHELNISIPLQVCK